MKDLGRLAYEAYKAERCKAVPNIPFEQWENLLEPQQRAWQSTANAVLIEVTAAIEAAKKEPHE